MFQLPSRITKLDVFVHKGQYLNDTKVDNIFIEYFTSVYVYIRSLKSTRRKNSSENRLKIRQRFEAMKPPADRKLSNKRVADDTAGKGSSNHKFEHVNNDYQHNHYLATKQLLSSLQQYYSRLSMLLNIVNNNKSAAKKKALCQCIFSQPAETLKKLKASDKCASDNTLHNILSLILIIVKCSRVVSKLIEDRRLHSRQKQQDIKKNWKVKHCNIMLQNRQAYSIYKKAIQEVNTRIRSSRISNKMPINARNNYVSMSEIKEMYMEIKKKVKQSINKNDVTHVIQPKQRKVLSNQLCLLSILLHMPPKRADFGNIRIVFTIRAFNILKKEYAHENNLIKPVTIREAHEIMNKYHHNIMFFDHSHKDTFIAFKCYKTAQHHQTLKEFTSSSMYNDIYLSLLLWPREYLFVQQNTNVYHDTPYNNNNSFTQFFIRTFQQLFNRRVGCSMFRHIFISEKVDPNKMSLAKQQQVASRMLHSHKEQMQYRWNDIIIKKNKDGFVPLPKPR